MPERPAAPTPPAPTVREASAYRPELDCLRFFAFLAVFLHHTLPTNASSYGPNCPAPLATIIAGVATAGAFGVDLFFALSAFLITDLLLREQRAFGRINIGAFYARRALRIWPLYFFFLALMHFLPTIAPGYSHMQPSALLCYLCFVGNWYCSLHGYPMTVADPLWSVSIEEQFYIVWPLVLVVLPARRMVTLLVALWVIASATRLYYCTIGAGEPAIWCNTLARLDPIACGVALAAVGTRLRSPTTIERWALLTLGLASIIACGIFHAFSGYRSLIAYPVVALSSAGLLVATMGVTLPLRSHIVATLVYLGKISYGLYVFHSLAIEIGHDISTDAVLGPSVGFALTIVMAMASYALLESPFLKFKRHFTRIPFKAR